MYKNSNNVTIGMMVLGLSGYGLFGDEEESKPSLAESQMETDPDNLDPGRMTHQQKALETSRSF